MIVLDVLMTIWLLVVFLATLLCSVPILLLFYPFLDQKTFARLTEILGRVILKAMVYPGYWTFKITDLRKDKTFTDRYIMIANHSSYIDTMLIWEIPNKKKFIMAEKFAKFPIFGHICHTAGHVTVDRFKRNTTQVSLGKIERAMDDGSSFMIYPEGRRSEDQYTLLPFKTGAFRIAQKTGVSILPIVLKGAGDALPVGGICHRADIEMIIGEPIHIEKDYENIKEHPAINQCREFIMKHLKPPQSD